MRILRRGADCEVVGAVGEHSESVLCIAHVDGGRILHEWSRLRILCRHMHMYTSTHTTKRHAHIRAAHTHSSGARSHECHTHRQWVNHVPRGLGSG